MAEAGEVLIQDIDEAFVKVDCGQDIAFELDDYFTFKVPGYQFTPAYRNKLWNGDIHLFHKYSGRIYRGLTNHIAEFCQKRRYHFTYGTPPPPLISNEELQNFISSLNLPNHITPRDYQIAAFKHGIENYRSLLLSPTASGKSLVIYMLARYLNAPTLIIVPTISLVTQLEKDFRDYGYRTHDFVHQVYGGVSPESDKLITISTWQSLHKLPKSFFSKFEIVIGDECHLFKAKSLTTIMTNLSRAKYRIGTTGTLDGTKCHKLVLEGLFGPIKRVVSTAELVEQKHLAKIDIRCMLLKYPDDTCKAIRKYRYPEEMNFLVSHGGRNKFISKLALSLEGNTLLLFQFVEKHGAILYDILKQKRKNVFFVHGGTEADAREQIRGIIEQSKNAIIIASYGVYSTGVNIKNLHNIIFASPSKSRIRNLQSIGRGLRITETKLEATLYDIADDLRWKKHRNHTLNHFVERLKIYSEEGFNFKIYNLELKGK